MLCTIDNCVFYDIKIKKLLDFHENLQFKYVIPYAFLQSYHKDLYEMIHNVIATKSSMIF